MKNRQASNGALINYTYDLVGNVTQVNSTCPWLQNQSFTETFSYDSTDQLVSANEAQSYRLAVNYGNWGKIMQYDLAQTEMLNNTTAQISRSLTYPSHANNVGNSQTPFAPTMQNGDEDVFFTYGINGSLRQREVQTPNPYNEYFLFNSQNNLKAYSDDIMGFAYYGYNAANTRTYKLSLYNTNLWINGQQQPLHLQLQQAMFYPNTYLNFDAFGNYTKHYYNGMERIASRLGDKNTFIAVDYNEGFESRRQQAEEQFRNDIQDLISESTQIDMPAMADALSLQPTGTPNDIYYYHPNHLGSTSFVTDQNQTITQGFLYAPFGEITTEYNVNFGNNTIPKYAFNAKELDEETGMYYYEARYYAPPTFTSRDVLFEKYFWISPYAYCANNPVKYVDPSGEKPMLYGLLDYYGIAKGGNSKLGETKIVGQYYIVPFYDNQNNLLGYNAGRYTNNGKDYRIEYQMEPGDLEHFVSNIKMYESAANLVYCLGEPDWSSVAMSDKMVNGDLSGSFRELGNQWANALKNPDFLMSMAVSMTSYNTISSTRVNNILKNASKGRGMYGLGEASSYEANLAGAKWVGKGARMSSSGTAWISADGKRQYRPPIIKKKSGRYQANFESRSGNTGTWENNGHLDIQ